MTVFNMLALLFSYSCRIATKTPSLTTERNIDTVISFLCHMFRFLHIVIMQHRFLRRHFGEQESQQDVKILLERTRTFPNVTQIETICYCVSHL